MFKLLKFIFPYTTLQFSFLAIFLCCNLVSAQVSDGVWEGDATPVMDEYGFKAVKNIRNNGYIFVGTKKVTEPHVNKEIYALRLDDNFEIIWSKLIGTEYDDFGNSLELTSDGGFLISGTTIGLKESEQKMYVLKLDSLGAIQWSKIIGNSNFPQEGNDAKQTPDGGFIVVGMTQTETNNTDMYIAKLDPDGNLEWDRIIGDEGEEAALVATIGADGNYVVAGYSDSAMGLRKNGYIVKLDPSGNLIWKTVMEITGYSYVEDIITVEDGFFLTGGGARGFVARMNQAGELQWINKYTSNHYASSFRKILIDEAGNLIAFGRQASFFYLVKTEPDGTFQWARRYWGQDFYYGYGIAFTDDGGLIMAGNKRRRAGGSAREFPYIMKTPRLGYDTCEVPIIDFNYSSIPDLDRLTFGEMTEGGGISSSVEFTVIEGPGIINYCDTMEVDSFQSNSGIKIYPNPAKEYFYIQSGNQTLETTIYNAVNQKIYQSAQSGIQTISTQNFSSGVYFVRIKTEHGFFTEKLVIEE